MIYPAIPVNLKYLTQRPRNHSMTGANMVHHLLHLHEYMMRILHHLTNRWLSHKFQHVLYWHFAENWWLWRVIILCACIYLCIYLFLGYKMMISLVHTDGFLLSNMRQYFGIWMEWPKKIHKVHYHDRWLLGQVVSSVLPKYEAQC